jgi:hypothetical protein
MPIPTLPPAAPGTRAAVPRPRRGSATGPATAGDITPARPGSSGPAPSPLTARGAVAGREAASALGLRGRLVLQRRARWLALAVGGFLLPWCALLALTLPATAQAQHWALAWTGLDAAEAVAALVTAALLGRADARASLAAATTGTLLLTDAWFDICTSAPGAGQALAVAGAAGAEVPLAIAAWWLAVTLLRGSR